MQADSLDERGTVSALAKLLHDELRDARFSVGHLSPTEAEFVLAESGARRRPWLPGVVGGRNSAPTARESGVPSAMRQAKAQ